MEISQNALSCRWVFIGCVLAAWSVIGWACITGDIVHWNEPVADGER